VRQNMSETLRLALQFAQANARNLNQEFVGTEHVMLGLLDCEASESVDVLKAQSLDRRTLRSQLQSSLPRGEAPPVVVGELPLSPKSQRIINNAIVQAGSLREPSVSTRMILLALLDENGTVLREILQRAGADPDELRRLLIEKPANAEA